MNYKLHNKVEFSINGKSHIFYNSMFSSVFEPLSKLKPFSSHISIGIGKPSSAQDSFKLTSYLKTFSLQTEICQSDISKGSLYIKKNLFIDNLELNETFVTELGLTNTESENPTIYNYISLINDDFPNGILIKNGEPLLVSFYLYLELSTDGSGLFVSGNNPFVEFLLGEGISGDIYAVRGVNLSKNEVICREKPNYSIKHLCKPSFALDTNSLKLTFLTDLQSDKTYEVVFMIQDTPFARVNLLDNKETISTELSLTPKESYILDLGEDVKSVTSITNESSQIIENNFYTKPYASKFGDKLKHPFNNLFNSKTPRFVSKDGDKIFFVLNDYIYAYKNSNYNLVELFTGNINIQHITNIISFENYVFVVSKIKPYICFYQIVNNRLVNYELEFNISEIEEHIANMLHVDITISNDGTLLIGFISGTNNNAYTIYLTYDEAKSSFVYVSYLTSNHNFSYVLAMYKNNFCDAQIFYVEEGEYSYECRLVTHFANKTEKDVYTVLAYYFTKDTKELHVKNRAVIVEKNVSPKLKLFYYPQVYEYELPLISDEDNNYISTNLLYLIQKRGENYKIYNLVGYNEPQEFTDGFPSEINQDDIIDFEFLNDTLLIFLNSQDEPIVAYNLLENSMLIENISSLDSSYLVKLKKYDIVGDNNEGVTATLDVEISL